MARVRKQMRTILIVKEHLHELTKISWKLPENKWIAVLPYILLFFTTHLAHFNETVTRPTLQAVYIDNLVLEIYLQLHQKSTVFKLTYVDRTTNHYSGNSTNRNTMESEYYGARFPTVIGLKATCLIQHQSIVVALACHGIPLSDYRPALCSVQCTTHWDALTDPLQS